MKKHYFFNGWLIAGVVIIAMLMNACTTPAYQKAIPADAVAVVELDVKNIGIKSDFIEQKDKIADLIASIEPRDRMFKKFAEIVKKPMNSGLDLSKPVYLFALSTVKDAFGVAAIKDQDEFIKTLTSFSDNFDVRSSGEISWIYVEDQLLGAVTKNTLLCTATGLTKEKSVYRDLLEQKKKESFWATRDAKMMRRHHGDITAMVNMPALSNKAKRDIRNDLERELGSQDIEEIWNQLLEARIVANLRFKSGKLEMNLYAGGIDEISTNLLAKKIEPDDLKKIPNHNLTGVIAFGIDGNAFRKTTDQELRPFVRQMSREERDIYNALGDFIGSMDGTIIGSVGGKDIVHNPKLLGIIPTPKLETRNMIQTIGEKLPEDVYLEGNSTHTAITNLSNYDFEAVQSPFEKTSNAKSAYLYAYLKAEPVINAVFDDMTRHADRAEMKVYNQIRNLFDLADYAELKAETGNWLQVLLSRTHKMMGHNTEGENKLSLTLYLNDNSKNALSLITERYIAIGEAIVDYENNRADRY